jgi:hypothetical protein
MEERFGQVVPRLAATRSRRFTLGGLVALGELALAVRSPGIAAKNKHKKKRKKKKPAPTCAELCGAGCTFCLFRADAPPLCGDGNTICTSCASDNDCVGEVLGERRSYCVTRTENRETGETFDTCGPDAACSCEVGLCYLVDACAP